MDTKSKKSNTHSNILKGFIVALFIIGISTFYVSGLWLTTNAIKWSVNPLFQDDYRDTYSFRETFDRLLSYSVETNMVYKSQGNIEDGKAINEDDLIESFKRYYNVADGIITSNTEIINDKLVLTGQIPDYLEENYLEYEYLVNNKLSTYRRIYIQNQLNTYNYEKNYLDSFKNFYYCIEDEKGNPIYGNAKSEDILKLKNYFIQQDDLTTNKMGKSSSDFYSKNIAQKNYRLYAGVPDNFVDGDTFYTENEAFNGAKNGTPHSLAILFTSLILCILMAVYIIRMAGQTERRGAVKLSGIDRIYNDIHLWLVVVSEVFLFVVFMNTLHPLYQQDKNIFTYIAIIIQYIVFLAMTIIGLSFLCSMSRQLKSKRLINHTLIVTLIVKIGRFFSNKSFKGWILFVILMYTTINSILIVLLMKSTRLFTFIFAIAFVIFNLLFLIVLLKSLNSIATIMNIARQISTGNFNDTIDMKKISPSFTNLAKDIINIQQGLKTSVEEAVKGERMKAELITNVSHDLKTPLTSIITYIDLLKNEHLNNERADGYVEILNEKALRLKRLIEDLIEASKASSGNLKVTKQRIDLRQLFMMASGEFEDKLEEAGISFRINADEETIIYADGNHMWRIIENLISNALKYSMRNSRVYVNIFKTATTGVLVMKNISEIPLDVSPEMLTERFVRGEESRTTEGSGLGLSIAKSLSLLQGGDFTISVDGDLFKATVTMPLWEDEESDN